MRPAFLALLVAGLLLAATPRGGRAHSGHDDGHSHDDGTVTNAHTRSLNARSLHDFDIVQANGVRVLHVSSRRTVQAVHKHVQPFPDNLMAQMDVFGTTVYFKLAIEQDLLHPAAVHTVSKGHQRVREGVEQKINHIYYAGTAKSSLGEGWARITVHDTTDGSALITGGFTLNDVMYYIKTPHTFSLMTSKISTRATHSRKRALEDDVRMVVYRSTDVEVHDSGAHICGVTEELMKPFHIRHAINASDLSTVVHGVKRDVPEGCPVELRMLYMGVAIDGNYVIQYTTPSQAQTQVLEDFNMANAVYNAVFNVMLGVINIYIKDTATTAVADELWNSPCSDSMTITQRLSAFAQWRGPNGDPSAGLYHLFTTCSTLPTIGIAWLNQLCQTSTFSQTASDGSTQYVSGCAITTAVDEEWLVLAHETGHNFGSVHDCVSSTCPQSCTEPNCDTCNPCGDGSSCDCQGAYIMNPSESGGATSFSPNSQMQMCQRSQVTGSCLVLPGGLTVLNSGICGNGIVEGNEQCDCGGTENCAGNKCCYSNCTLTPGSQCDNDTNTPCCKDCQISQDPTQKCHTASDSQCDLDVYCDSTSKFCPPVPFNETDGNPCNTSSINVTFATTLRCASGICTSREVQCYERAIATSGSSDYTQPCGPLEGSCQMFCSSQTETCTFFYGAFINGTPCGSGYCYGGTCSVPDLLDTIISFIQGNLVMVVIGAAMIAILILGFIVWGCQSAGRKEIDTQYGRMTRMQALQRSMTFRNAQAAKGGKPTKGGKQARPMSGNQPGPPPPARAASPVYANAPPSYEMSAVPPSMHAAQIPNRNASPSPKVQRHSMAPNPHGPHLLPMGETGSVHSATSATSSGSNAVRCPLCSNMFPSEAVLNTHIDLDHA